MGIKSRGNYRVDINICQKCGKVFRVYWENCPVCGYKVTHKKLKEEQFNNMMAQREW